jgi:ketosteroid isomerase-like protein
MHAGDLHRHVEEAFNRGDVEALVALHEPHAYMVREDASVATGTDAIREVWTGSSPSRDGYR